MEFKLVKTFETAWDYQKATEWKCLHNQPERSKREDSFNVRTMEDQQNGYFSVCQVSGTNDWIEMRCSEHGSNVMRDK